MTQTLLNEFRTVVQQKKAVVDTKRTELHIACRSLAKTQSDANALIVPLVQKSIDAYNVWLGEQRVGMKEGMYTHVNLDSMQVSVTFDVFYPPLRERIDKKIEIAPVTEEEERQVAEFLSKDLAQQLKKAGYDLVVGRVEYNWDI